MECSATIGKLSTALAKAQGEIRGAAKDTANPFFKSKYADLASVRDAIQEALSKHGIAYVQFPEGGPETITITTILACGEEWMRGSFQMRPVKADPQGMGSAITYARRYALMAAVGVAPEDDDGNAASNPKNGQGAPVNAYRGNPLRPEFQGFSFELDGCKSKEQIDLMLGSPEYVDFKKRDDEQAGRGGVRFADHIEDKAHKLKQTLPDKIEDKRNLVKTLEEYPKATKDYIAAPIAKQMNELAQTMAGNLSALAVQCMERFDIVDTADDFKAAQKFAMEHQGSLTADEKTKLNALSKKVGARLRETA